MSRFVCRLCVFLAAVFSVSAAPRVALAWETSAVVVVVHKDNPLNDIESAVLARIYKGKQNRWPNGREIVVVDRPVRSKIRSRFYSIVLRSEPAKKFYLTGSPIPFRAIQIESENAVTAFISRVSTGIAYIESEHLTPDIKALSIDGKPFSDPDYLLRPASMRSLTELPRK